MAIARKPAKISPRISKEKEAKADKFVAAAASHSNGHADHREERRLTVRVEAALMDRLEPVIKASHLNLTAFFTVMITERVKKFESEGI